MARYANLSILLIFALAFITVAGCTGGSNNSLLPSSGNPTTPSATHLSADKAPKSYRQLYDLSYYWNAVRFVRMSEGTYGGALDNYTPVIEVTCYLSDTVYNDTPARRVQAHVYKPEGLPAGDEYDIAMDLETDLYYTRDANDLKLLGGHMKMQYFAMPEMNFEGDVDPRLVMAQLTGNRSLMNEALADAGAELIEPDRPFSEEELSDAGHLNLSQVLSVDFANVDLVRGMMGDDAPGMADFETAYLLAYNGIEPVRVGEKTYECYNLSWRGGYIFWYSPEFPAMPLRYIVPGEETPIEFRVEEFR